MKVGDVVQLKSGGPQMTVKSVNGLNVTVTWFEHDGAVFSGHPNVSTFLDVCLKKLK